jgi:hypothetical protein
MAFRRVAIGRKKPLGVFGAQIFFSTFFVVGFGMMIPFFFRPWLQCRAAASWAPTSCVIDHCTLVEKGGRKGHTYGLDVAYSYNFEGRKFMGHRYDFFTGFTSSRGWREKVCQGLTAGKQTVCYVDPAAPGEAVLSPDLSSDAWFALIPGIFAAIGAGGLVGTFLKPQQRSSSTPLVSQANDAE